MPTQCGHCHRPDWTAAWKFQPCSTKQSSHTAFRQRPDPIFVQTIFALFCVRAQIWQNRLGTCAVHLRRRLGRRATPGGAAGDTAADAGGEGETLDEAKEPKEAPDAADATEPGEPGHARALAS